MTHFFMQVDEVSASFQRAINTRLQTIANKLILSIRASSGQFTLRNLPNLASNAFLNELQGLIQDVNESLLETLLRASKAFPRFVSSTNTQNESLDLSLIDPFGLTELGQDNNTFIIIGEILGITEDEARELFAGLLLFGLGLSDVWQILLLKQRDRLRQQIAQALSFVPDDNQVIPPNVLREVEKTISNFVSDTSINSVATSVTGITSSVLFTGVNKIIQATVKKNQTVFSGKYLWVGILDSAICKQCAALYGKTFIFGDGPLPQLHPWCRCFVMPILDGAGPVGVNRFNDWLKSQNKSVQDSILGKRGAELFRQGKVKFRDFVQFRNKVAPRERTLDSIERIAKK